MSARLCLPSSRENKYKISNIVKDNNYITDDLVENIRLEREKDGRLRVSR